MSVQIARKVALAYWGFSKKATARAKAGIDIDIVKGNGGPGLEKATASAKLQTRHFLPMFYRPRPKD